MGRGALLWALCGALAAQSMDSVLRQAVLAQQAGDDATAIRLYQEVLKQQPRRGEVRSNLGAALAHEGRFRDAVREYELALKDQPGNPGITLNLALAHYKLGECREVIGLLEPLHPEQQDNLQPALLLATCLTQTNQSGKVVELLRPVAERYPENLAAAFLLGTAYLNLQQVSRAEALLDRILRNGESAEAQMLLGASKLKAREFNSAVVNLRRAVELNPELPQAHAFYGKALQSAGDTPAAAEQFRAELARNPFDFVSNLELTVLLKQEGNVDEALKRVNAALQVRPDDPGALYQQASIYVMQGKNEPARVALERIVKENPTFTEAQVSLATVYYRLNRREDGDRVRQIVRKLQAEEQKRQDGAAESK